MKARCGHCGLVWFHCDCDSYENMTLAALNEALAMVQVFRPAVVLTEADRERFWKDIGRPPDAPALSFPNRPLFPTKDAQFD